MSEPATKADRIQLLSPWLYHWWIRDDRLNNFRSESYAVLTPAGKVLIDPLPLAAEALAGLGQVAAICLTQRNHQRSAWAYRRKLRVPVYAPRGDHALDETPDQEFVEDGDLPDRLAAIAVRGLPNGLALVVESDQGTGAIFCGDLITRDEDGPYRFPVEPKFFDPAEALHGLERLTEFPADSLCPAHGAPAATGCRELLQGVAERERRAAKPPGK